MLSPRLQHHFIRLWQSCQGQNQQTTLSALAQQLNCSRRHMRNLLNAMQQQGWLTWQSEAGRGKRSQLCFLCTGQQLQQQRAEALLEQDHIDQLVQLVGDKQQVRQMITAHLGRRFRHGRAVLRILYYRPLLNLLPGSPLRRSEIHLARHIFSGLTRINEENGEVEPDIAHHWQMISPEHWRFFLRPAIRFHDGRELSIDDIINSLQRLRSQPLFSHLQRITAPSPRILDIHLNQPDRWLPWLLGSVSSMILPQQWQNRSDFARSPAGTGPYAVVHNRSTQLKIQAFDDYFGYRALIDEINIWVLPEISEELVYAGVKLQTDEMDKTAGESQLEEGGYFLLFDQRSEKGRSPELRRWLCTLLNPITLLNNAGAGYQRHWFPAWGLLPRWHHRRHLVPVSKPEGLDTLILTGYRDHIEHQRIVDTLEPLLAVHGVRLITRQTDYQQWYHGMAQSDLWLGSANFTLPLEFSLFALLYEIPLLHHCIPIDWQQEARRWRTQAFSPAAWSKRLVDNYLLHPLFHHWLQLQGQRSMRGVRMNTLGWFDFKSAWFAPPEK